MGDCKLSNTEAIALFVNLFCAKLFLITPKDFTDLLGPGAILFIIVMYLITFLLYWFYTSKNISKIFCSKMFLTVLSFVLIIYGAIILSRFVYFTKTVWFLRSPLAFITLVFGACMMIASKNSLKTLGKINGFFVPILYLLVIVLIGTSIKAFDLTFLTPILGKGFPTMAKASIFLLSSMFEFVLLLFLPEITNKFDKKTGFSVLGISLFLYLVVIFAYLLVGANSKNLPLLYVIQSGLLSKSDSLFLIIYAISGFLYLSSIVHFSAMFFCSAYEIKDSKAVVYPVSLIIISLSGITFFNPKAQLFLKGLSSFLWVIPFLLPIIFLRKDNNNKC